MQSTMSWGRGAGILYLINTALPVGGLWILITYTPEMSVQAFLAVPGMKPLLATLSTLAVSSLLLGALLIWKPRVGRYHLAAGVLLIGVALTWNELATLLWLLPLLFAWQGRRKT